MVVDTSGLGEGETQLDELATQQAYLALEEADAKLVYWVKDQFGYGSVKFNSFSKTALAVQTEKSKSNPRVVRFIIRSKIKLIELLDCLYIMKD